MTVLQRRELGGLIRSARGVAIALTLVVLGVVAGFVIDRAADDAVAVTYEGPLVERSLAMEAFYNGTRYEGPMVKRSLAMEAFYNGTRYEGPLVERSLAMEEFYNGD